MGVASAKQLSKRAAASVQEIKNHLYNWLKSRPLMAGEDGRIMQEIMKMISNIQANTFSDLRSSVLSIGQYADATGTQAGKQIGSELANFLRTNTDIKQKDVAPAGLAGKKGDPKILKWQKEWNRIYGKQYKPIPEDGVWGPKSQAAYLIQHRQERLEKERPTAAPNEGFEGAQRQELKMRPQDAEALMLQKFQGRFGRLPLNRVPELVEVLKSKAKELHAGGYSPEELSKQFEAFVGRITPEDVKQYMR